MTILHPDIRQFIEQMTGLGAVGCLRIPRSGLRGLLGMLDKADVLIGRTPRAGRATCHVADRTADLAAIAPPAILVVTEEDYDDPAFAEKVRSIASYFLRVG